MKQFFTSFFNRPIAHSFFRIAAVLVAGWMNQTLAVAQTNLVANGDFSAGNTGFTSEYVYSSNLVPEGNYYVGNNPRDYHLYFCDFNAEEGRSPGSAIGARGNMLIGNASGDASLKLWTQTIALAPNTDYSFSFWAVSLAGDPQSLKFGTYVNCATVGNLITATSDCNWVKYTMQFNSGSRTSIELSVRNLSLERNGNDIALDDLQLYAETPETPYPSITAFVWKGYTTDWFDADNWGNCSLPSCADNITIPAGLSNYPLINTNAHPSGLAAAKTVTIQAGGALSMAQNTTLNVCGDFVNNGTLAMDQGSTVTFTGTSNQEISIGGQFANLRVNQSAGKVLSVMSNVTITGKLTLTSGLLKTNTYEVNVTNSDPSAVAGQSTNSYVVGNLRRAVQGTATYDFPVGDPTRYELMRMYVTAELGVNSVLGTFVPNDAVGTNGLPLKESLYSYSDLGKGGYWHLTPDASPVGTARYDLELSPKNIDCPDVSITLVKRTNAQADWSFAGSTGENGNPYRRNGYSTFSEITLASGGFTSLPISLVSFGGAQEADGVHLSWTTVREQNGDYFAIEKSRDNRQFAEIGQVKAVGESHSEAKYAFLDGQRQSGTVYYRLRMVDQDGSRQFSKVMAVEGKDVEESDAFTLYPNPSESRAVRLRTAYTAEVEVVVHTHVGLEVSRKRMTIGPDGALLGDELPRGVYIVRMITPAQTFQQKLVVR